MSSSSNQAGQQTGSSVPQVAPDPSGIPQTPPPQGTQDPASQAGPQSVTRGDATTSQASAYPAAAAGPQLVSNKRNSG